MPLELVETLFLLSRASHARDRLLTNVIVRRMGQDTVDIATDSKSVQYWDEAKLTGVRSPEKGWTPPPVVAVTKDAGAAEENENLYPTNMLRSNGRE